MNVIKALLMVVAAWFTMTGASASTLALQLQSPDHVLLMRHALAPGFGDPEHFSVNDCSTQRNLSEAGRAQARSTGQWLRQQGVRSAQVYASPWCRCQDTARELGYGAHEVEAALGSFFQDMRQAQATTRKLQQFLAKQLPGKGQQALILVTHHVNIQDFVGENVGSGEMVLVKVDAAGRAVSHQRVVLNQKP
jgi:phosphohistidine phosphatase SixA